MPFPVIPAIGLGLTGISLLDQLFGSGKDVRESAERSSRSLERLSEAQIAELLRATGLRKDLQGQVEAIMEMLNSGMSIDQLKAKGVLPPGEVDFSKVLDQFIPGIDTSAIDLESLGPGITRGAMFDRLMGLAGTASGQGGVTSAAALANQRDLVNQQQVNQTIDNLIYTLLNWQRKDTETPQAQNPTGPSFQFNPVTNQVSGF